MKITCKASNTANDVRCTVCGQGFLVEWARGSAAERARQFSSVVEVLRRHHVAMDGAYVHPRGEFCPLSMETREQEFSAMFPEAIPVAA